MFFGGPRGGVSFAVFVAKAKRKKTENRGGVILVPLAGGGDGTPKKSAFADGT